MARAPAMRTIDAAERAPEADRLSDFPHPRETRLVHGHDRVARGLEDGWRSGRMHHATLMCGRQGIGKATLVYRFAKTIFSGGADAAATLEALSIDEAAWSTPAVRQVENGLHPNMLVIRRQWQDKNKRFASVISVDDVRQLRNFLVHTVDHGVPRLIIVDQAEDMNLAAANALLKSLEEPPDNAFFFLISSQPDRLLPTIRSRCRRIDLAALGASDLVAAVGDAVRNRDGGQPDAVDDPDLLTLLAQGSPRRALMLQVADGLALYRQILKIFGQLGSVDLESVHMLAEKLSPVAAEQSFALAVELMSGLAARIARCAAAPDGAVLPDTERALAAKIVASPAVFAGAPAMISEKAARGTALNLDRKSTIIEIFLALDGMARGREIT